MFVITDLKYEDFLKGMTISRRENSLIEIAHKEIIVPEKKIVLLDEINEDEMKILKKIGCYKGGLVLWIT